MFYSLVVKVMPDIKIWGKYGFQTQLNSKSAGPTKYCLLLYISTNNDQNS